MATIYYKRDGTGTINWNSATSWSTVSAVSSTNAGTYPIAGDTANFASGSIGGTVNVASACAVLNMTGFASTLSFTTYTLTVSGAMTLQGGFANSSTGVLLSKGGVTLAATPTGSTFPILQVDAVVQTLTSGGFEWPGAFKFNAGTTAYTIVGNWKNNGLTSISNYLSLTGASYNFTCAGGLYISAGITTTGISQFQITGGTWSAAAGISSSNVFIGNTNITGVVTVNTYTLISGSAPTGTGTVYVNGTNVTLTSNNVALPNLHLSAGSTPTYTLAGNLLVTGNLLFNVNNANVQWMNAAYDIVCGNLFVLYSCLLPATSNMTFNRGRNITVTNSIFIGGCTTFLSAPFGLYVISNLASAAVNLNFTGSTSNEYIFDANFTDVKADGSGIAAWVTSTSYMAGNCAAYGGKFYRCVIAHTSGTFSTDLTSGDWVQMILQPIYNQYYSTPSVLLRTAGIVNVQANSFVGMFLG